MQNRKYKRPEKKQDGKAPKRLWTDDFESVAKRLECDEDKARFEAKLGKLAKTKPKVKHGR